ncbi:sensor histidine kinase [Actinomadura sp. 6N118]|uniref:sensor histidine kinase n=1 Tax=Actinomadura sp. 6N118 TaxID=3375151 RepID=UPI00379CC6B3
MDEELRSFVVRRLDRRRLMGLDALAALAYTFVVMGFTARQGPAAVPLWAECLIVAVNGLPLAVRRLWPLPVFGVTLAMSVLSIVLDMPSDWFVASAFALYLVALTQPRRRWIPTSAIGVLSVLSLVFGATVGPNGWAAEGAGGVIMGSAIMGGAWTLGRALRERRAYAQRSAAQLADRAVTDERIRIARELHDVVAHSMSLIVVKAGVANHVAEARPDEARDALRVIEATSRAALTEMRQLLGVLRTGMDYGFPAPPDYNDPTPQAAKPTPGAPHSRTFASYTHDRKPDTDPRQPKQAHPAQRKATPPSQESHTTQPAQAQSASSSQPSDVAFEQDPQDRPSEADKSAAGQGHGAQPPQGRSAFPSEGSEATSELGNEGSSSGADKGAVQQSRDIRLAGVHSAFPSQGSDVMSELGDTGSTGEADRAPARQLHNTPPPRAQGVSTPQGSDNRDGLASQTDDGPIERLRNVHSDRMHAADAPGGSDVTPHRDCEGSARQEGCAPTQRPDKAQTAQGDVASTGWSDAVADAYETDATGPQHSSRAEAMRVGEVGLPAVPNLWQDVPLAPAPGLAALPTLVDRAAMAGVRVALDLQAVALPEGVALSAYRIVQEALTNVVKHAAPARCQVSVWADEHEVRITVTDDGPGTRVLPRVPGLGEGHGLIGMRERVMMYGGDFSAGPRPEGGFGVSARLPYNPTER